MYVKDERAALEAALAWAYLRFAIRAKLQREGLSNAALADRLRLDPHQLAVLLCPSGRPPGSWVLEALRSWLAGDTAPATRPPDWPRAPKTYL